LGKSQKEYYLNEQMKAIQKELNSGEDEDENTVYLNCNHNEQFISRIFI